MNRFYISRDDLNAKDRIARIKDKATIKHITKSLRLKTGDAIELTASENESYIAEIDQLTKDEILVKLRRSIPNTELPVQIDLFQGIPKGHKWDYLIQKSVECGVRDIYPVQMRRSVSVVKAEQSSKKQVRWQKIAEEAAKQSKRSYISSVKLPASVDEAIKQMQHYDLVLIAYVSEKNAGLRAYEAAIKSAKKIAVWVGPEGGIDEDEINLLSKIGQTITLGKRTLRTETAGVVILSKLSYILE